MLGRGGMGYWGSRGWAGVGGAWWVDLEESKTPETIGQPLQDKKQTEQGRADLRDCDGALLSVVRGHRRKGTNDCPKLHWLRDSCLGTTQYSKNGPRERRHAISGMISRELRSEKSILTSLQDTKITSERMKKGRGDSGNMERAVGQEGWAGSCEGSYECSVITVECRQGGGGDRACAEETV